MLIGMELLLLECKVGKCGDVVGSKTLDRGLPFTLSPFNNAGES